jgi:hypothetical protein
MMISRIVIDVLKEMIIFEKSTTFQNSYYEILEEKHKNWRYKSDYSSYSGITLFSCGW